MSVLLITFTLAVALLALLMYRPLRSRSDPDEAPSPDDIDDDMLAEAEREVQDADGPDDVRDWGPGAPH